jgi:hypothetical protein
MQTNKKKKEQTKEKGITISHVTPHQTKKGGYLFKSKQTVGKRGQNGRLRRDNSTKWPTTKENISHVADQGRLKIL